MTDVNTKHDNDADANVADTKKQKLQIGAVTVDVVRVEIAKRLHEEPNEYMLDDGSIIRVANPTIVVYRVEGFKDWKQNPAYYVENGTTVIVVQGPQE